MRRTVALIILSLCAWTLAQAQQQSPAQSPYNKPVSVRGQVYTPEGGPAQAQIRIALICDDPSRPLEYHYTDSNGRFVLPGLFPHFGYRVVVEGDGKNWGTTTESFLISDPRFTLSIRLRPPDRDPKMPESRVSVNDLKQDVPKPARKEYEGAMERMIRGESERARLQLERAIELFPDFVEARNELAVMLLRDNHTGEAEAQLRRALQVDGDAVRPLLNLGLCLYRQEKYKDAIPPLEHAMQLQPENHSGNLLLGMTMVMSGDDAGAEPVLVKAYQQGGKRAARAQFYLSHIYTRRKDYGRAATALETYLNDAPADPNAEDLRATLAKLRAARKS